MTNKDEIVKLLLKFCYGAEEVFIHTYPDVETLSISKYVSFSIDSKVKHMVVEERRNDFTETFDVSKSVLTGRDGALIWTPSEIVLFSSEKVLQAIDNYNGDVIPISVVSGFLTRINIESNE
jgi:hypothetical protein